MDELIKSAGYIEEVTEEMSILYKNLINKMLQEFYAISTELKSGLVSDELRTILQAKAFLLSELLEGYISDEFYDL